MTIRHTTEADIAELLGLAQVMHRESPHYRDLSMDEEKVGAAIRRSIADGPAFVHVNPEGRIDGAFHAIVGERWFARERMVSDLALFVQPDRRGGIIAARLIQAFVAWCSANGFQPQQVMVGITTGVRVEETRRLYERLNFEVVGEILRLRSY